MTAVRHVVAVLMLGSATAPITSALDWTIEPVGTSGDLSARVRTAVDETGRVYAASLRSGPSGIWFSSRDPASGTWDDPEIFYGSFFDFTLDLDERPHLLYRFGNTPKLARLGKDGVWDIVSLPFSPATGLSLFFNSQNLAHISYVDTSAEALKYATWDGADWTITTVATGPDFRYENSLSRLALDKNDVPHFLYYEFGSHNLEHAYWNGSGYEFLTIDQGRGWSMVFSEDNLLHLSYVTYGSHDLMHARFDGSNWSTQAVDLNVVFLGGGAIALDSTNTPHVVYMVDFGHDPVIGELRHAEWTGTMWETELIDSWSSPSGASGTEAMHIVIDDLNRIHTIYTDDHRDLYYATAQILGASPDINGDGVVDAFDLAILLGSWGPCGGPDNCPADLNLDGTVNAEDLAILLNNWG